MFAKEVDQVSVTVGVCVRSEELTPIHSTVLIRTLSVLKHATLASTAN